MDQLKDICDSIYDSELSSCWGYMGACEQIGNTALRMMHPFHVQQFALYPALAPSEGSIVTPHDLTLHLHHLSLVDRTRRYLSAIEALYALHSEELAHTSLPEQWPTLRESLVRFPD